MNRLGYLDTCTLLAWAAARLADPTTENQAVDAFVESLVNDGSRRAAVSEFTLLEFYDNAALWFRRGDDGADEPWLDGVVADVNRWLADGRLHVLTQAPKLYEHAMRYVRLATQPDKRKFRAMDAGHLVHAVRWARAEREQVDLFSYDPDFQKLIRRLPGFTKHVVQVDPRNGSAMTAST